jgi:plasmid stabilization system protein ParE
LPYVLVYRLRGAQIDNLRVLHTARRWPPHA